MSNNNINRREFLTRSSQTAVGIVTAGTLASFTTARTFPTSEKRVIGTGEPVRIGIVGVGSRGTHLMKNLLKMKNVSVPAVCDINLQAVSNAQDIVVRAGQVQPEGYQKGPEDFKRLMNRDDLDAIIIATYWEWHTPMAVYAMKAGKYVGVEVPAAITLDESWDLVRTHEATGVPCMMLENWSYRQDNLAVLNMIRKGLLGEIVHCHSAHSHNCVYWYFGRAPWTQKHLAQKNADQYPTHSLGPVLSWMDINCGDRFDYVTSMATRSMGINDQLARKEGFGPDHPDTKRRWAQGDIVTTMVKTVKGNTIVINNDMQLPRPYDNRWLIQGTRGLYNEQRNAVFLEDVSPAYEEWEPFPPYQEKYDNSLWKNLTSEDGVAADISIGHGGVDYLMLQEFVKAVRNGTQTPIDVYDSVTMSAIIPLSEQSIAKGSAPVKCPDFTRGKWKTKKSSFALDS